MVRILFKAKLNKHVFKAVNREDESFLNVLYANLDSGILNKKVELSVILSDRNPDLVIFNEILPKKRRVKKKLSDKDFILDGYECIIRSTTEGRGVVIYYKQFLNVQLVEVLNKFDFEESIWLRVQLKGSDSLLVGCICRSPSSSRDNNIKLNDLL